MNSLYMGLDLGQSQDFTVYSIIEKNPISLDGNETYRFDVRHLERFPLGTSYPTIVQRVVSISNKLSDVTLVVDATGVGRPVIDLLIQFGLHPIAVTIHGGDATTHDGQNWRVPKRDLISTLSVMLQTSRLKIAPNLLLTKTLVDELLHFKVKIDIKTSHDSYEACEGDHDDLVMCVALACWGAEKFCNIPWDEWTCY